MLIYDIVKHWKKKVASYSLSSEYLQKFTVYNGRPFEKIKENPKRGGYQSILGLAVAKRARDQGIAKILIKKMEELAKVNEREGITLACKQGLVSFMKNVDLLTMVCPNHSMVE